MTFSAAIDIIDQAIPAVSRELLLAKLKYHSNTLGLSLDSIEHDITISGNIFVMDIAGDLSSVKLQGLEFPVQNWETILCNNLAKSEFGNFASSLSYIATLDRYGLFDMMNGLQHDVARIFNASPDIVINADFGSMILYLIPADLTGGKPHDLLLLDIQPSMCYSAFLGIQELADGSGNRIPNFTDSKSFLDGDMFLEGLTDSSENVSFCLALSPSVFISPDSILAEYIPSTIDAQTPRPITEFLVKLMCY